jgi:hypothetical protein
MTITDEQQRMFDLLQKQEELDPELEPYLVETAGFLSLKHPLVFDIMHIPQMNARCNEMLRYKKESLAKAEQERKWGSYIWLHERPYRLEAFAAIKDKLTDEEYWDLLGSIWSDMENLWQYAHLVPQLINCNRHGRDAIMNEQEKALFDALPPRIAVYRGHQSINRKGWSWSLSYWQAQWFAHRFNPEKHGVVRGTIAKEDVIGVILGRNESEVIANPAKVENIRAVSLRLPAILKWILSECTAEFKLGRMSHHGLWHWEKVLMNATAIAKATKGADPVVCRLFAMIHDCKRQNENDDPEHGERAAALVRSWRKDKLFFLNDEQIETLASACERHEKGEISADPTIGCCWDADRLDLIRVQTVPDLKLLSTQAAKELIWTI